jgi:hypothetical protein
MRKTTSATEGKHIRSGREADMIAVFLAALIVIPFLAEWIYWAHVRLGH